ncbi:MAG: beta-ketoacyl-ACP synthase II [Chloroflexi bacterium]|nr:beta-ketoacyl-ACP synthase II [Chloroflexota bacterium]
MGVISPLGLDLDATWQALLEGRSGADYISRFDAESFETRIAAEVKGFDAANYMDRKEIRRTDLFVQYAIAASRQAVKMAELTIDERNADHIGVIIGSGIGGIATLSEQFKVLFEKGPRRVSPFLVPMYVCDMAPGQVSIALGAKGPNFSTTSSCASGADAVGVGFEIVRRGDARVVIAGGSEAPITPIGLAAFGQAGALSKHNDDPSIASRPFDAQRDGFVMGEGGAILVLEDLESAIARGAPIFAEMLAYGATSDAYHITHPPENGEGGARAIERALAKAELTPEDIDYISAHGTSTPLNDRSETLAVKKVFAGRAYHVPMSSAKSMVGHMLGAAGAIGAIASVQAIRTGLVHPTINQQNQDPDCDLDYVPNVARQVRVDTAMVNAFGFGGHNASLIFRRSLN